MIKIPRHWRIQIGDVMGVETPTPWISKNRKNVMKQAKNRKREKRKKERKSFISYIAICYLFYTRLKGFFLKIFSSQPPPSPTLTHIFRSAPDIDKQQNNIISGFVWLCIQVKGTWSVKFTSVLCWQYILLSVWLNFHTSFYLYKRVRKNQHVNKSSHRKPRSNKQINISENTYYFIWMIWIEPRSTVTIYFLCLAVS